ncbi:MAG: multiple sugar transport system permease protein, partial [Actinomycetota bacterium]|nr:multiple sugar transport system permease protein [Actinomycetota bacterium]
MAVRPIFQPSGSESGATQPKVPRRKAGEARRKNLLTSIAKHAVALFFVVVFLSPFVFVLLTAVMTQQQALSSRLWPHPFQWSNFAQVFTKVHFWLYTYNTVFYAVLATIGVVVSSVPVAYALARMRWRGRQATFLVLLSTLMLPAQITIVPLYVVFSRIHWVGTFKPLIVPAFFGDVFSIFLLRQFFMTIPEELVDAARADGANEFQIMWHVI